MHWILISVIILTIDLLTLNRHKSFLMRDYEVGSQIVVIIKIIIHLVKQYTIIH